LGGDEVAVLLTNASLQASAEILSRLSQHVEEYNRKSQRGYDILYSVGTVQYDSSRHSNLADLMVEADMLMYEQKQQARCNSTSNESSIIPRQSPG
jgi:diguanylate cyclase (GGDEF)-like protein